MQTINSLTPSIVDPTRALDISCQLDRPDSHSRQPSGWLSS